MRCLPESTGRVNLRVPGGSGGFRQPVLGNSAKPKRVHALQQSQRWLRTGRLVLASLCTEATLQKRMESPVRLLSVSAGKQSAPRGVSKAFFRRQVFAYLSPGLSREGSQLLGWVYSFHLKQKQKQEEPIDLKERRGINKKNQNTKKTLM